LIFAVTSFQFAVCANQSSKGGNRLDFWYKMIWIQYDSAVFAEKFLINYFDTHTYLVEIESKKRTNYRHRFVQ